MQATLKRLSTAFIPQPSFYLEPPPKQRKGNEKSQAHRYNKYIYTHNA